MLSLTFREMQLYFMSKIRSFHSNQVFLKNILDRKNLKYRGNEKIFTFTVDNQNVGKKKRSQFHFLQAKKKLKKHEFHFLQA